VSGLLTAAAVFALTVAAEPGPPCAGCVVWQATPEQADALLQTLGPIDGLEILLRPAAIDADPGGLERRLTALRERGVTVGLAVPPDVEPAALAGAHRIVAFVPPGVREPDVPAVAFRLKSLATALRAQPSPPAFGLEADEATRAALLGQGLSAYLDFVVGSPVAGIADSWSPTPADEPVTLDSLMRLISTRGSGRLLLPWPEDERALMAQRALREVLPVGLSPLPAVKARCGEQACPAAAYLHPATLDAVLVFDRTANARALEIAPAAVEARLYLPQAPDRVVPLAPRPTPRGARIDLGQDTQGPFVVRVTGWTGDERLRTSVEVAGEPSLTVAEVIARHQASVAWQAAAVRQLIASGRTVVTFQLPGLAAPLAISADTVLYEGDGVRELEQRVIRLGGQVVRLDRAGVPRLPLIEPERASAVPLALTLDEAYAYRLEGRSPVRGHPCYVVAFAPRGEGRALLRGRAYVDARSFGLVRLEAVQTGLRGPIVSSEESVDFVPREVAERTAWLPARAEAHQIYEGPGHRTALTRLLVLERHEVNPADYEARRRQAHAGPAALLRDGPEGLRYLPRAREGGLRAAEEGRRVSRVLSLALGALFDPNIDDALPFAGVSYVDFDVFGSGVQVSAFAAGAVVQLAWSTPAWGHGRWQLLGSAFASLVSYNDRVFRQGVEQYGENLRQRPLRASVALVRPLGARLRLRASYELEHTSLARSSLTAPTFVEPLDHTAHGLRLAMEAERGPWSASLWGSLSRRPRWRSWGEGGSRDERPRASDYSRFGASLGRTFVPAPTVVARVEAEAKGGRDLDRFSRFNFDGLESRLHGYPSAALRYDHGGALRSSLTWSTRAGPRLSAFADGAFVRDPGFGPRLRSYLGAGAAFESPLPAAFLLSAEWGYGFQGRDRAGRQGTHVGRITLFRVF
jgi:hypothetical protein